MALTRIIPAPRQQVLIVWSIRGKLPGNPRVTNLLVPCNQEGATPKPTTRSSVTTRATQSELISAIAGWAFAF